RRDHFPPPWTMRVLTGVVVFLSLLQQFHSLEPGDCNASEKVAEEAVDLINKDLADAHVHQTEYALVSYLVLDVIESDCSVLSRVHWKDCKPPSSRRRNETNIKPFILQVIGQCKVIATTYPNTSREVDKLKGYNCTTSSVSSALTDPRPIHPVIIDYFENTEEYGGLAEKALDKYNSESGYSALFKVDRVERAVRGLAKRVEKREISQGRFIGRVVIWGGL
uniref:Histidine-rich glycoprotein n=1 Tax=Ornithorhynchus anatinus TaxID=9258 RepID=A0A6I8NNI7_ORNAN